MKKFSILLFVCAVVVGSVGAATVLPPVEVHAASQWYVSPNGSSGGSGSQSSPWDLQTALNGGPSGQVQPGDTVWLLGGTYNGTYTVNISGSSGNYITIRNWNGQRATINQNMWNNQSAILSVNGSYLQIWGLEIESTAPTNNPWMSDGIGFSPNVTETDDRIINCVVHDAGGIGISNLNGVERTEVNGTLMYYNGRSPISDQNGNGAYGTYTQNVGSNGQKLYQDNFVFSNWYYGAHVYTQDSSIDNFKFDGNTMFNNAWFRSWRGGQQTITPGTYDANFILGGVTAHNLVFTNNYMYFPGASTVSIPTDDVGRETIGFNGTVPPSPDIEGNYFIRGKINVSMSTPVFKNNHFYDNVSFGDAGGTLASGYDTADGNTYSTPPNTVIVRKNKYETGRANIIAYNFNLSPTVTADVSSVLQPGDSYVVKDVQDFYGTTVAAGTYTGGSITIPMDPAHHTISTAVDQPIAPVQSAPEFAAMVLMRTSGGGGGSTPSLSISPSSLSFSAQQNGSTPAAQSVSLSNTGGGTLPSWGASGNQSWLSVSPSSGSGNGSISVSANPSSLAAGTYAGTVTVTASGASGSPQNISVSFTISGGGGDTTSPTVSLTAPAANATLTGTATLSASAADNVGVTKVEFYVDGSLLSTDTSSPYAASWNTANVSNGSHALQAKAYDAAGNVGTSAAVGVTVSNVTTDTTAPTITPTAPAVGATLSGVATLSATASDPDDAVSSLSFYVDGSLLSTDTTSPYTASWDTTSVSNGSHTISEKACDTHSNCATTQGYTVTVSNGGGGGGGGSGVFSLGDTVRVVLTTDCVNARDSASLSSNIYKCEVAGTQGTVLAGPTPDSASGYTFWKIAYTDGVTGWSADKYLEKVSGGGGGGGGGGGSGVFSLGDTVRVVLTTDCVNARDSASLSSNIYKCEVAGTQGTVLAGPTPDSASGYTFWKIAYTDGVTGWSADKYLEKVSGSSALPVLSASPSSLSFSASQGGNAPAPQSIGVSNAGGGTLSWSATGNATWFSVAPSSGTNGGSIAVSMSPAGLAAGTYTGAVTVAGAGSAGNKSIPVSLVVVGGNCNPNANPGATIPPPSGSSPSLSVYQDSVLPPWQKASFRGVYTYNSTAQVHSGSASIKAVSQPTGSVSLQSWTSPQSISGYTTFQFWVYPTTPITLHTTLQGPSGVYGAPASGTLPANQWSQITIPLANYKLPAGFQLTRIYIGGIGTATTWYLDDVGFGGGGGTPAANTSGASNPSSCDTTPPTVSLTAPATNATVSGTVSLTASASDNVGVTSVSFYVDGSLLSTDTSSPYIVSWDTTSASNGSHTLTAKAYDAANNVGTSASVTITVSNAVVAPPSSPVSSYGPGIGADSLNNHQISSIDVDYRFRAAVTGAVKNIIWYDIFTPGTSDSGYSNGTGGSVRICLQTDDGTASHLASGTNLACVDDLAPKTGFFPVETFSTPPTLTAGQLYHIHWHNLDPSPDANHVSVDGIFVWDATTPRQPTYSDTDLAVFRGTTLQPRDTPIFQATYTNGTVQGVGYMEFWVATAPAVSGANQVREQFTVTGGDKVVSSLSLRMMRDSTSAGTSPLTVTLETVAGTIIERGTIPAVTFPLGTTNDTASNHNAWGTLTFSTPHTLTSGQTYQFVLSAPADTTYRVQPMERGNNYSFIAPTFFGDGFGQFSADGGTTWSGFNQPGGRTNNNNADVQFYFSLGTVVAAWYKPTATSPAIGKATSLSQVTDDYFGSTRGAPPDMGAVNH